MTKIITLEKEHKKILKDVVSFIYPGAKVRFTKDFIMRIRVNDCYHIDNYNIHWIEFIYKVYFPHLVKHNTGYIDTKHIEKNYSLYSVNVKQLIEFVDRTMTQYFKPNNGN